MMTNSGMQGIASLVASQGRNGDTMLMHVAPEEVQYLDSLGGITRNPVTDLPEAFKLKDLLPFVGSAFLGPAFKAAGFSPGISSFLASTATTMLGGGSLEKGIMSGLVSSSIGRLGQNLADTAGGLSAEQIKARDSGYRFGIFKAPQEGTTFGSRYSEAFRSPQFNPVEMFKGATEGGLENFLEQIQKPSVMIPFSIGAGELARMSAEERYARDFANFQEAQKRRRAELQLKYPQILPGPRVFPTPPTGLKEGGIVQRKFDGEQFSLESFDPESLRLLLEMYGAQDAGIAPQSAEEPAVESFFPTYDTEPLFDYEAERERIQREAQLEREAEAARVAEQEATTRREAEAARAEQERIAAEQRRIDQERQIEAQRQMDAMLAAEREAAAVQPETVPLFQAPSMEPPAAPAYVAPVAPQQAPVETPPAQFYTAPVEPQSMAPSGVETVMPTGEDVPLTSAPVAPSPTNLSEEDKFALMSNLFANLAGAQPVDFGAGLSGTTTAIPAGNLITAGTGGKDLEKGNLYDPNTAAVEFWKQAAGDRGAELAQQVSQAELSKYSPEQMEQIKESASGLAQAQAAQTAAKKEEYLKTLPQRQALSDLLKAGKFKEAFDYARENNVTDLITNPAELKNLRDPFTKDELVKFMQAVPPDLRGKDFAFNPEMGVEYALSQWMGNDTGFPDALAAFKSKDEFTLIDAIIRLGGAAILGAGALDVLGAAAAGAGGGGAASATAGGATAAGGTAAAGGAGGIASLTGVVPTGLVGAGGLQTFVVPAVANALTASQIAGILGASALTGGALASSAPASSQIATGYQPTQPVGQPTPSLAQAPADDLAEIVVQTSRPGASSLLGPGTLASTSLIKGMSDIPVDIYGNPLETVTVTAEKPVATDGTAAVVGGAAATGAAATTGGAETAGGQGAETAGQGTETPGQGAEPTTTQPTAEPAVEEFTISTGNPDMPFITVPAGSLAEKILEQTTTPDTGRTETLTDKAKDYLTDYLSSEALNTLLAALAGGTATGTTPGATGGGYRGTGGTGTIPTGFERQYVAAPQDYLHGFMPEFAFFTNLNPPAALPGTEGGEGGGGGGGGRGDDTGEGQVYKASGGILPRRKSYSERDYLDLIQGYQEGGEVEKEDEDEYEDLRGPVTDGNKSLVNLTKQVILGQITERADEIIQKFIDMFGLDAFQDMREDLLEESMPNSTKEGMVPGHTGGMDDMVDGVIGNQERVAVSPGEYIIPADVVSALGDGNSKKGEAELNALLDRVRQSKYGSTKQPPPINIGKVMPA